MNCFEARQDFRAFWRRELDAQRQAALAGHMKECNRCDAAFRAFALSAPGVHSGSEPERSAVQSRERRVLVDPAFARVSGIYRDGGRGAARSRPWLSMAAAVALFVAGASAAYLSVRAPAPSLTDASLTEAVNQPEPFVELVSVDMPGATSDFAQ